MKSNEMWKGIKRILGFCPYHVAGKQVAEKVSGKKKPVAKKKQQSVVEEERFLFGMFTGRNIVLVGVFCPIFWVSLFMGVRGSTLVFNAIHSGIVIAIGGAIYLTNHYLLRCHLAESKVRKTMKVRKA